MVALSTLVCTKNAKIIFSRQFVKMSRLELEEHVVHFTRNIETCKDNSTFESEKARYIFIPIENLYLVLLTDKDSNLIEDIEITKLIYRLIQDICGNISENNLVENAFEIIMGIDDIVSMGYRDAVSIAQIKQFMVMDSQDEKEFRKIQEQREKQAKKELEEKGKEFEKKRRENKFLTDSVSSANFESNNTIQLDCKSENLPDEKSASPQKDLNIENNIPEELTKTNSNARQGGMKLGAKKKDINSY